MKILVIAAGKPSLEFAKIGIEEYCKRLGRYAKLELKYVKDGSSDEVSARLLEASRGCLRIAMDPRGANWDTETFAGKVEKWQLNSIKSIAFLIGAADGHNQQLRDECAECLSLGKHTMQHELALLVLLEQIYRIHTFLRGEPYHRP